VVPDEVLGEKVMLRKLVSRSRHGRVFGGRDDVPRDILVCPKRYVSKAPAWNF